MPKVSRLLWDAAKANQRLGEEGYPWFVERAERQIAKCTACNGTGEVPREPTKTDLPNPPKTQNCPHCATFIHRLEDFCVHYFLRMPPAYRQFTLTTLQPYEGTASVVSLEKQKAIIDMLKEFSDGGWLFFGPPHTGKTVWTSALYAHNLYRFFIGTTTSVESDRSKVRGKSAVWRTKAKTLLDQHTVWSMKRFDKDDDGAYCAEEPDITVEKIVKYRRLGVCSKLYLEEIDKVSMTESRTANLFEIIDTLHEEEGVVVINSNLRPEEFTLRFGEQFTWRLGERSKIVNLFEK
jgi:hypothetical protein